MLWFGGAGSRRESRGSNVAERSNGPTGLAREAIGLREVRFQSITHMAPAAAVAFSSPFGITYGGGATPLPVPIAIVACLLVGVSIGQVAQ